MNTQCEDGPNSYSPKLASSWSLWWEIEVYRCTMIHQPLNSQHMKHRWNCHACCTQQTHWKGQLHQNGKLMAQLPCPMYLSKKNWFDINHQAIHVSNTIYNGYVQSSGHISSSSLFPHLRTSHALALNCRPGTTHSGPGTAPKPCLSKAVGRWRVKLRMWKFETNSVHGNCRRHHDHHHHHQP